MLSIKNLVKIYRTKGGAEVRALDGVTVDFPEKGMVFLLGKSGSGKSTLLNVAGGLDRPDQGEVIVKGKSSKDFSVSDFDSYRNTYIGFIFQEYNILEEFNVEQNVSLALQLQGRKNDREAVEALLKEVDLEGLGKRRPNTLSGGQRQRVAIARALVKEPEIIMADEPTGALDSNTGKQVLETLKKLSADKLVIVVSHDREYAEQYGDRVIELKDGKIVSDTSKAAVQPEDLSANVDTIGADTVRVKDWTNLTREEFDRIWTLMKGRSGEALITLSATDMPAVKRACKIADDGSKEYFKETDKSAVKIGEYDASRTRFIKSRMPMKKAIKMGASSLKTKPIRLIFTILLSVISFAMFGVLSTLMVYDPIYSVATALENSPYDSAMLYKNYNCKLRHYTFDSDGKVRYSGIYDTRMSTLFGESEVKELNKNSEGLNFSGIMTIKDAASVGYSGCLGERTNEGDYYSALSYNFSGFTDCGERYMTDNGFTRLAGNYPTEANEIAVSEYVYEAFAKFGYEYEGVTETVSSASDLVGKKIAMSFDVIWSATDTKEEFTITGVYRTGSLEPFKDLQFASSTKDPEEYKKHVETFTDVLKSSYHPLCYVSDAFFIKYKSKIVGSVGSMDPNFIERSMVFGTRFSEEEINEPVPERTFEEYFSVNDVKKYANFFDFYKNDGSAADATSLTVGRNEVYAPLRRLYWYAQELYNSGLKQYGEYRDYDGEIHEFTENEYAFSQGFYMNYDGDVSFEKKDGYAEIDRNSATWINASGEISHDFVNWSFTEDCEYFEDANGKLYVYVYPASSKVLEESDYYFVNAAGDEYRIDPPDDTWTRVDEKCYYDSLNKIAYLDLPYGYYVQRQGDVWRNTSSNKVLLTDPASGWKLLPKSYFLDFDGNIVADEDLVGYDRIDCLIFFNSEGQYSFTRSDEFTDGNYIYFIDAEGNVSKNQTENSTQRHGYYVNGRGEKSFTKKDGYFFTDHYYYNKETGEVKFVTEYDGYWTDAKGNRLFSPYNGKADQFVSGTKSYGDYEENADFAAAFMRVAKACILNDESDFFEERYGSLDGVGEFTNADLELILSRLERDFAQNLGREINVSTVYAKNADGDSETLSVIGFYTVNSVVQYSTPYILSEEFALSFQVALSGTGWNEEVVTKYVPPDDMKYAYIISLADYTVPQMHIMLDECENDVVYIMTNIVYNEVNGMASTIDTLKMVFIIAGAIMAALSALMLFNFISASISSKRKEIGVLRAVGARGADVFKIFFAEAFIIAVVCFVFSAIAAGIVCVVMDGIFMAETAISLLDYGIFQVLLILGISMVISFIATILPVYFAAKKPPVESIREL